VKSLPTGGFECHLLLHCAALDATHGGDVFDWLKVYLESIELKKEEDELFYYNELMTAYRLLTSTRTFSSNPSLKDNSKKPSLKIDNRKSSSLPSSLPSSSLQESSSREGYSKATSSNSSSPFHATPLISPHTMDSSDTKYRHSLIHDAFVSGDINLVHKIADLTVYVIQSLNKTRRNLLSDTDENKNTDKNIIPSTDTDTDTDINLPYTDTDTVQNTDTDINLPHPLLNKTSTTISGYYDRGLLQYAIYIQSSSLLKRLLSPPWSLHLLVPARLPWDMCRGLSLNGNMLTSLDLAASLRVKVGGSKGRGVEGSEDEEGEEIEKAGGGAVVKDLKEEIKKKDKNGVEGPKEAIKEGEEREKEVKKYDSLNEPNEFKRRQLEEVFSMLQRNDENINHPIFPIDMIDSSSNYHGDNYYGKYNDEFRNEDNVCVRIVLSHLIYSNNLEKYNVDIHNTNEKIIHDTNDHTGGHNDSYDYSRNKNHLFSSLTSAFHLSLSVSNDKSAAYILSALVQISKSLKNLKNKNDSCVLDSILNKRGEMDIGLRNECITQCCERNCPITLHILLSTYSIKDTTNGDAHSKKNVNSDDIYDENNEDDDTYDDDVDSGDFLSSLDTVFDDVPSGKCDGDEEIVKSETVLLRDTGHFILFFMYIIL
jgi:hypothetical protein